MIDDALRSDNAAFRARGATLPRRTRRKRSIPTVTDADVREMLIQHILTEEIFVQVFDERDFHRENNVAKELYALEDEFFTGDVKKRHAAGAGALLRRDPRRRRADLQPSREADVSQGDLRELLQGLQPESRRPARRRLHAERDRALHDRERRLAVREAFRQDLIDKDVEILDPGHRHRHLHLRADRAFPRPAGKLRSQIQGGAARQRGRDPALLCRQPEHRGDLCGDHRPVRRVSESLLRRHARQRGGLGMRPGSSGDLFGSVSDENVERIKRQNRRKISVIIGNPPYNANQQNENDNNKNRDYPHIDQRSRRPTSRQSTAQKTKLYDMYARFFRWATRPHR